MAMSFQSKDPADIAQEILTRKFKRGRVRLLHFYEDDYLYWNDKLQRWEAWHPRKLFRLITRMLRDAKWKDNSGGAVVENKLKVTSHLVNEILHVLESETELRGALPQWVGMPSRIVRKLPDPKNVVVFRNHIIDVEASVARYKEVPTPSGPEDYIVLLDNGPHWVGLGALPYKWDPKAEAPTWERCQRMWLKKDADAIERRERFYGDCLRAMRKYPRVLVEYGKGRGGKGSGTRRLSNMIGQGYFGTTAQELAGDFGTEDFERAKVVSIGEVGRLDGSKDAQNVLARIKTMVGDDVTSENRKGVKLKRGVKYDAKVIVQGNDFPQLPDNQAALLNKMVPVYFARSWSGREDFDLEGKLASEEPGIARRFVEALVRLDAEENAKLKFPMGESGEALLRKLRESLNPCDAFLHSYFTVDKNYWVHGEKIRTLRAMYEDKTGILIRHPSGARVSDQHLLKSLCERSGIPIWRGRRDGKWGLYGIRARRVPLLDD